MAMIPHETSWLAYTLVVISLTVTTLAIAFRFNNILAVTTLVWRNIENRFIK